MNVEIKGTVTYYCLGCEPDGQDYARVGNVETTINVKKVREKGKKRATKQVIEIEHELQEAEGGVIEFHLAHGQCAPTLGQDCTVACLFTTDDINPEDYNLVIHQMTVKSAGEGDPHDTYVLEIKDDVGLHEIGVHCAIEGLDWKVGTLINVGVKLLEKVEGLEPEEIEAPVPKTQTEVLTEHARTEQQSQ